jgi:hypothetical protein
LPKLARREIVHYDENRNVVSLGDGAATSTDIWT